MKRLILALSLVFSSHVFSNTWQCQVQPGLETLTIKASTFGSPDILEMWAEDSQVPFVVAEGAIEVKGEHLLFVSSNEIYTVNIFVNHKEGMMMIGPRVFKLSDCQKTSLR